MVANIVWLSGFILGIWALVFFKTKFEYLDPDSPNELPESLQIPIWVAILYFLLLCVPFLGALIALCFWGLIITIVITIYNKNSSWSTPLKYKEGRLFKFLTKTF